MERHYLINSFEFRKKLKNVSDYEYRRLRESYDDFLEQPLELWMFVPCDEEGNVLEDPCQHNRYCVDVCQGSCAQEYYKAKERVLFEGCEIKNNYELWCGGKLFWFGDVSRFYKEYGTIEYLTDKITEFNLTETAIKQLGL